MGELLSVGDDWFSFSVAGSTHNAVGGHLSGSADIHQGSTGTFTRGATVGTVET